MENKIIYRKSANPENNDNASGSKFWSIEGKNVQFTYFDVPANRNFPTHKHECEQITYVIEGELFFRFSNTFYKLTAGDCIFIPGNIQHEVWTENVSVKAIDAWSPVNQPYSNK